MSLTKSKLTCPTWCLFCCRFLADDRRELHFRVEVQNKVYRRELHLLDNEINKLERQIVEQSQYSSKSSLQAVRVSSFLTLPKSH